MAEGTMNGKAGMVGVYLLSLLAILLWGMSYLWSDSLLALGIPVEYIVFARISIAGVVLLVFNLATGQNIRMQKKHVLKFILIAFFEPFIYFVCETYGIRFTESPTISSLLIAAAPIFSVIAGMAIFNEKFSLFNMFGILVCLGGIVMVTLCSESMGEHFVLGIVLLVVAVLAEVGHASLTKYLVRCSFSRCSQARLKNFDAELYLSWDVWKPILCLAVLCSSIAFGLWANTIKHLGVAKSSIFLSTIPVFTALAGWILGQELLTPLQWAGIFVACIGVVFSQYTKSKPKSL